jgi:hypothetical protein
VPRRLSISVLLILACIGCAPAPGFHAPTRLQRLPSGKVVAVTSLLLVWGVEHDERHPEGDSFALEYVSPSITAAPAALDQEALEVFELIRPVSEQWGFDTATISAFPSPERTGKYEVFVFSRSTESSRSWTHVRRSAKVFNTDSGRRE